MNSYHKEYLAKEILSKTLSDFLGNLSDEGTRLVSLNIISKYAENKSLERIKKAKALFRIYSKQSKLQRSIKKKQTLRDWKKICQDITNSINSKSFMLETSAMKKEREEFELCTFKPEINKNYEFVLNKNPASISKPVHERLYTDLEKLQNKKALKKYQYENREMVLTPFSPDITLTSYKNKDNKEDFFARQEKFRKSKTKNRENIRNEVEEDLKNKYTFSPKILKSTSVTISTKKETDNSIQTLSSPKGAQNINSINNMAHSQSYYHLNAPAHIRLYEDNFRRERNIQMTKKQISDEIIQMSEKYISSQNRRKSHSISKSPKNNKSSVSVNLKNIEKLYNDHKKNKMKKRDLQKEIDIEQGLTFKPLLCKNEKYTPNMKFLERNQKLIQDKKNFVDVYNQIYEENLSNVKWGAKKCTPHEFEEINKNVIERLYMKGVEKTMLRNSLEDCNMKEKVDFKKFLRNGNATGTGGSTTGNFNYNSNSNNSNFQSHPVESSLNYKSEHDTLQERFYSSPKHAESVKNKVQNKNLTFGKNNNSKEESTSNLLLQSQNFNKEKNVVNNYTFGGKDRGLKQIDKNYQYKFDEEDYNYEENEEEEVVQNNVPEEEINQEDFHNDSLVNDHQREERVKPVPTHSSTSSVIKSGQKNKIIILDNVNSELYEPNMDYPNTKNKSQNENIADS